MAHVSNACWGFSIAGVLTWTPRWTSHELTQRREGTNSAGKMLSLHLHASMMAWQGHASRRHGVARLFFSDWLKTARVAKVEGPAGILRARAQEDDG